MRADGGGDCTLPDGGGGAGHGGRGAAAAGSATVGSPARRSAQPQVHPGHQTGNRLPPDR